MTPDDFVTDVDMRDFLHQKRYEERYTWTAIAGLLNDMLLNFSDPITRSEVHAFLDRKINVRKIMRGFGLRKGESRTRWAGDVEPSFARELSAEAERLGMNHGDFLGVCYAAYKREVSGRAS